jgi:hypothetical protein
MRFSFRSRLSSSRSAVVRAPGLPRPVSARACSTQFRSDDSVRSRSQAVAGTVLPSSSTSRTAPALNSSLKLRRVRFRFVSAIVDIVSAFRKVSTKPDQAHLGRQRSSDGPLTLWQVLDVISERSPAAAELQHPTQHANIHVDRAIGNAGVVTGRAKSAIAVAVIAESGAARRQSTS